MDAWLVLVRPELNAVRLLWAVRSSICWMLQPGPSDSGPQLTCDIIAAGPCTPRGPWEAQLSFEPLNYLQAGHASGY